MEISEIVEGSLKAASGIADLRIRGRVLRAAEHIHRLYFPARLMSCVEGFSQLDASALQVAVVLEMVNSSRPWVMEALEELKKIQNSSGTVLLTPRQLSAMNLFHSHKSQIRGELVTLAVRYHQFASTSDEKYWRYYKDRGKDREALEKQVDWHAKELGWWEQEGRVDSPVTAEQVVSEAKTLMMRIAVLNEDLEAAFVLLTGPDVARRSAGLRYDYWPLYVVGVPILIGLGWFASSALQQ